MRRYLTIIVALIGAAGTIIASIVTARSSVKADINQQVSQSLNTAFRNLRPVDIQADILGINRSMSGWDLDKDPASLGKPERTFTYHVNYPRMFSARPTLCLAIRDFDAGDQKTKTGSAVKSFRVRMSQLEQAEGQLAESYPRILVYPTSQNEKGFDLVVQVWNRTRLYAIDITWIAFEQVAPSS